MSCAPQGAECEGDRYLLEVLAESDKVEQLRLGFDLEEDAQLVSRCSDCRARCIAQGRCVPLWLQWTSLLYPFTGDGISARAADDAAQHLRVSDLMAQLDAARQRCVPRQTAPQL